MNLWLETIILGISPSEMNSSIHGNLHEHVYSTFICNSYKLQTTQISFNKEMVNQTPAQMYRILLGNPKKWTIIFNNMNGFWSIMFSERKKKANLKRLYIVYSTYITFLKWRNYRNGECSYIHESGTKRGMRHLQRAVQEVCGGNRNNSVSDYYAGYRKESMPVTSCIDKPIYYKLMKTKQGMESKNNGATTMS